MSKECEKCVHWSRELCTDKEGNPLKRQAVLAEPTWYYQTCKKNWGLPSEAHINANNCKFYRTN